MKTKLIENFKKFKSISCIKLLYEKDKLIKFTNIQIKSRVIYFKLISSHVYCFFNAYKQKATYL